MKLFILLICLFSLSWFVVSCAPKPLDPPTVATLEKSRYAGQWHEIARLPNPFEKDIVAATATYGINPDGTFSVRNDGLKKDGTRTSITGTAKPADSSAPGKLLVRFDEFPANFFAGDYWILDVNPSYTRALVGSPDRKFLWFLSKNPADRQSDFKEQFIKATSLGYETGKVIFNPKRLPE
ncbi:MAG: lipocalin family protein [Luteolibacter sp.]